MRTSVLTLIGLFLTGILWVIASAESEHQIGAAQSGRSFTSGGTLESLMGQTIAGGSEDLAQGFLCLADGRYYLPGDADGNLMLNISDAVYLIGYIFGDNPVPDPYVSGDSDCNHVVNISDALVIIGHVFGGQPKPSYCS
jgi:hypothetical protein